MLTLVTSNPAKYAAFAAQLRQWRIELQPPKDELPELQGLDFEQAVAAKARTAAAMFGQPVLVDDAGLVLEAYHPFPGPLTSTVLPSLGVAGLRRLLSGTNARARMECHLGCWIGGALRTWTGKVSGKIDFTREPADPRMPLSDLFVPDDTAGGSPLQHRARALAALADSIWDLHLDTMAPEPNLDNLGCSTLVAHQCPFCTELEDEPASIFAELIQGRLASRIIYEDDNFVLMPPLGEFIEGGLLLLSREHIPSFAHLATSRFKHLERLLERISEAVAKRWGVAPLIFEHGPAPQRSKGVCCVDHAHLNIFPARVHVHPSLAQRMSRAIGPLADLRRLKPAEFGYLFVQENDGSRRAYDGENVPTQLVRRIITTALGLAERWHWRDYPGYEELITTYNALKGQIHL